MGFDLSITESAEEEIFNSYTWYEQKFKGLGTRFVNHLDSLFERIQSNPRQFPINYKNYHQALLRVFPFVVVYLIEENEVIIESVFHTSQDPEKKYRPK